MVRRLTVDELKDELLNARLRILRLEGQAEDLRHWVGTLVQRLEALENAGRTLEQTAESKP